MAIHTPPKIGKLEPTKIRTRYHIDYEWWQKSDRDLRIYLYSHLCPEHQSVFATYQGEDKVDWIDPRTAEVRRVDGLEHTLHSHCSLQPEYITPNTTLINALFRVFLANGNAPLTAEELAGRTGRRAEIIERTLGGDRIYKGIRPVEDVV